MQASFATGEISPLLHARVDLARYATGLAELKNMIVLPQGGVTRRGGFTYLGSALDRKNGEAEVKLIPFEYNSTDSELLEFGDYKIRVWQKLSGGYSEACTITSPYALADVKALRYVQSGNVIFLAHRNYKPQMLTRQSLTSWTIKDLPFSGGPWIDGAEWAADVTLAFSTAGATREIYSNGDTVIFTSGVVGSLLKVEYAVKTQTYNLTSTSYEGGTVTNPFEVKGTMNIQTSGAWRGTISVERSLNAGSTWVTVRQYIRTDTSTQGQWDFTITETDSDIFYRIRAKHQDTQTDPAATLLITVSGFLKSEIYKITAIKNKYTATVTRQGKRPYFTDDLMPDGQIFLWSMGAWGEIQGYPCAVCMYQDRLIFAGSKLQPQTLWMSRTGDYADFSTSDPLSDDDAVIITLAGSSADGIHSLISAGDLLAFTNGGEWKIRGEGSSGAITPTALIAHQQTNIGTNDIQPLLAGGRIIFVQSQGRKVYALNYDLNTDGYAGSELSILSGHLFKDKTIIDMAYQKEPDSVLWFVLDDGTLAACTYNPEHEVIGWSRHEAQWDALSVCALSGASETEVFFTANLTGTIIRLEQLRSRVSEASYLDDNVVKYESILRTLRLNTDGENGNAYTKRKLIARVKISALGSSEAWAAPGEKNDEAKNWERRRKVIWKEDSAEYISDADVQLDNGFSEYACIQIRNAGDQPLTIAAITPIMTNGGD